LLGWRKVPVDPLAAGDLARQVLPVIEMLYVGDTADGGSQSFERRLYLLRKVAENRVRHLPEMVDQSFHMVSLSSRTLVYKGMLLADQIPAFFPDLTDASMVSALALVHQRCSTNTFPAWELAQPFRYLCHAARSIPYGATSIGCGPENPFLNPKRLAMRSTICGQ
jgi:glutamate synthase domain-containing protein 1